MPAPFGDSTLTKLASLIEASSIQAAMEMVQQLMSDHEAVARTARSVFDSQTLPMINPLQTCSHNGFRCTRKPPGCCAASCKAKRKGVG